MFNFAGHFCRGLLRIHKFFMVHMIGPQGAGFAVCLQTHPARKAFAQQKWQHIITKFPFGLRGIDLNSLVKVEQAFGAVSIPTNGVKRCHQGLGMERAWNFRGLVQIGLGLPAINGHGL